MLTCERIALVPAYDNGAYIADECRLKQMPYIRCSLTPRHHLYFPGYNYVSAASAASKSGLCDARYCRVGHISCSFCKERHHSQNSVALYVIKVTVFWDATLCKLLGLIHDFCYFTTLLVSRLYYDMTPESRNSGARVKVHC
jgi:hypothetical protein